jgi:hypothetical protein
LGLALLEALLKHIMHLGTNGVGVGGAGLLKELEKVEAVPKIEMIEVEKADEIEEMGRTEGIGEPEHGDELEDELEAANCQGHQFQ